MISESLESTRLNLIVLAIASVQIILSKVYLASYRDLVCILLKSASYKVIPFEPPSSDAYFRERFHFALSLN